MKRIVVDIDSGEIDKYSDIGFRVDPAIADSSTFSAFTGYIKII